MKDRARQIKIYYDGTIDKELDKALASILESLGFEWYASGFDLRENRRDLCFKKNL